MGGGGGREEMVVVMALVTRVTMVVAMVIKAVLINAMEAGSRYLVRRHVYL